MDYEQRLENIHTNFILKMVQMYQPPKHIAQSAEAKKLYCKELREAINKRMDSRIPNREVFESLLAKVWDRCITENTYRLYFTPALVSKHASKVNAEYAQKENATNKKFEEAFKPKAEEEQPHNKTDAAAGGWTIEKCDAHIAEMKRMIEAGEINRYMGQRLMGIPTKAKERLLNAGQTVSN